MAWKKWLIRGLICALLATLVAGAGLLAVWTQPSAVRRLVAEQLTRRFQHISVQVGSARFRLLGGVLVHDLRVARSGALDRGDFLYVPDTVLYHDKEQVLDGKLALRKIDMDRPQIRLVRERDGRFNLSGVLGPVNPDERMPTVVVRDGTLLFEDRVVGPGSPLFEIRNLHLTLLNDPVPVWKLDGTGDVDVLGPVRLRGTITRAGMAVHLEIDHPAVPVGAELWGRVGLLFPAAGRHLRQLTGRADVRVKIDLPGADAPPGSGQGSYQVQVAFSDGRFSHPSLPLPLEQIRFETRLIDGTFPSARLTAHSGGARLDVRAADGRLPTGPVEPDLASVERLVRDLDVHVTRLSVTEAILKTLPPPLAFIKEDYSPSGPVSLRYRFRRPDPGPGGAPGHREWAIEPQGMRGSYHAFPYPLDDVRGTIRVDTSAAPRRNIRIDLTGKGGGATAALRGTVRGEPRTGAIDLRVSANEVGLDETFNQSLPESARKATLQFLPAASRENGLAAHPMGKADVVAAFRRAEGSARLDKHFTLHLKQVQALYDQFPYPLEDVSGVLELYPDHWVCRDFRGRHAGGEVAFEGRSFSVPSAPGVPGALPVSAAEAKGPSRVIKISFVGKNILLDPEFDRALRPISGPDRQGLQSAWRALRLAGRMDFTAEVVDHADRPQDVEVKVALSGPSMRPTFFDYALDGVSASARYSRGQVTIDNVRGRHGAASLGVDSGVIQVGAEGGYKAWLTGVTARGISVDADLVRAVPETCRRVLETLRLKTPVEVAANLTLVNPQGPSRAPEVWWEGALGLERARFRAGVDVTEASGRLFSKGYHDGQRLRGASGQLRLAKLRLFDQPLTDLSARLDVEPSTPDVLRVRDFQARLFGGTVHGEGRLETGTTLKYDLWVGAAGIQLDALGRYNLGPSAQSAQFQGPLGGSLHLAGQGQDLIGLRGNGRVDVTEGKMGQLPVLLDLFKAFGLRAPDKTAFEEAHAAFSVAGPQLSVRQLDLVGNAVSLHGQGKIDVDGSNIELDFNATPGRSGVLPDPLDAIPNLISGQILKIKMRGKFGKDGKVRFDKELIPGVLEPIRRAFEGGS